MVSHCILSGCHISIIMEWSKVLCSDVLVVSTPSQPGNKPPPDNEYETKACEGLLSCNGVLLRRGAVYKASRIEDLMLEASRISKQLLGLAAAPEAPMPIVWKHRDPIDICIQISVYIYIRTHIRYLSI